MFELLGRGEIGYFLVGSILNELIIKYVRIGGFVFICIIIIILVTIS